MCLAPGRGWGWRWGKQKRPPEFMIPATISYSPTACWAGECWVAGGRDPESHPGCKSWHDPLMGRAGQTSAFSEPSVFSSSEWVQQLSPVSVWWEGGVSEGRMN